MNGPLRSSGPEESTVLDLSRNEGDLPPPECLESILESGPTLLRDYQHADSLEAALADFIGVDSPQVLATTGGDDALDRVFRHHLRSGDELIVPVPTFEMIPAFARMIDARLVPVEYEWGTPPVDQILSAVTAKTRVVAVVSPDNPTGAAWPQEALMDLANALPAGVMLVIDQAYVEFADDDPTAGLLSFPNVLLVRTLSKAWGLAGLRIGYVVGPTEAVAALRDVGGPYPVSGFGVAVALHRLQHGQARLRRFVAENRDRRERLKEVLRAVGAAPLESQANFVLGRFESAARVHRDLEGLGIRTRFFAALPDHLRITVPRTETEFARLADGLRLVHTPAGLLFDIDGVLADVRDSYRAAIKETCARYGVEVSDDDIARSKSRGHANDDWAVTQGLLRAAGVDAPLPEVTERFEAVYQGTASMPGLWRTEVLIPDRARLKALSKVWPLGVVTGRPRRDAERFLDEAGIRELFGALVCREDAPLKPDPTPVRLAMSTLGVETAWFLGDTPDDIVAGTQAGALPVGVLAPGAGDLERGALEAAGAVCVVQANSDMGGLLQMKGLD